jgi:hypothetical protein
MKIRSLIPIFTAVLAATESLSGQKVADSDTSLPVPAPASQPVEVSPYAIAQRGLNQRVWQRITVQTNNLSRAVYRTNSYIELASGICAERNGQWIDAIPDILIGADPSMAYATNGAHLLSLVSNPNTATGVPAVQVATPDGKLLSVRIYGLSYLDTASGQSVLISELQDSVGQLLLPDQVLYTNALGGDCPASLLYRNTLAGCEQFILLNEQQPPAPEDYGLNSASTMLQVLTEFFNPPTPVITTNYVSLGPDGPVFPDETLDFGTMKIDAGKAFLVGNGGDLSSAVRVLKQWTVLNGRTFLVEQVPLTPGLVAQLQTLPPPPPPGTNGNGGGAMLREPSHPLLLAGPKLPDVGRGERGGVRASLTETHTLLALPKRPQALVAKSQIKNQKSKMSKFALASAKSALKPGFLIDFSMLTSQTNFTFQGDSTYYISGLVNISGTNNVLEGGSVLKFTNLASAEISLGSSTLVYKTSQYRPAVFTSKDDNTVGDTISGSTGNPTNSNGGTYLYTTVTNTNTCFRMSYAGIGILSDSAPCYLSHGQFIKCLNGIYTSTISPNNVYARNVLFCSCSNAVFSANLIGQHVTADQISTLAANTGQAPIFTNSILTAVTNWGLAPSLFDCETNASGAGIYQTVGAAGYYLADQSPYRNAGTVNIDPALLSDLAQRTTFPPLVFFGASHVGTHMNMTLLPQAQRDGDGAPDLGYHYDPLDYAFGGVYWTNVTLTVNPGTAIGLFCTNAGGGSAIFGLVLDGGGQFTSQGTPNNPNWVVRYNTVQEQSNTNWSGAVGPCLATGWIFAPPPPIYCRFNNFAVLSKDAWLFEQYTCISHVPTDFQDCQAYSGVFGSSADGEVTMNLTNCLFQRVDVESSSDYINIPFIRNNLFWRGTFNFDPVVITNAVVRDNLFDQTSIPDNSWDYGTYAGGYNAFVTNYDRLQPTNSADIVITNSPPYQTDPFGNSYYYPPGYTLIDVGSSHASLVGLYWYTSTTNQVPETNSIVDIGFHRIALGTNGLPIDTSGTGTPNYLKDLNGNGTVDSGEINWLDPNDFGLKVLITRPKNNSVIP